MKVQLRKDDGSGQPGEVLQEFDWNPNSGEVWPPFQIEANTSYTLESDDAEFQEAARRYNEAVRERLRRAKR